MTFLEDFSSKVNELLCNKQKACCFYSFCVLIWDVVIYEATASIYRKTKNKKCDLAATNNVSVSVEKDAASSLLEDEF